VVRGLRLRSNSKYGFYPLTKSPNKVAWRGAAKRERRNAGKGDQKKPRQNVETTIPLVGNHQRRKRTVE